MLKDDAYVKARNALIPKAAKVADRGVSEKDGPRWTRLFMNEMDRLARASGLVSGPPPGAYRVPEPLVYPEQ